MEEKFYLNDFELSLQEQANQFKMVPTRKVWHGIYNDLHPGRRWPSVMVSLLLIFSIVFIGYINTHTDKNVADVKHPPLAKSVKNISNPEINNQTRQLSVKPVKQTNDQQGSNQNNFNKENTSFEPAGGNINLNDKNVPAKKENETNTAYGGNISGEKQSLHSLPVAITLQDSYLENKKEINAPNASIAIENSMIHNSENIIGKYSDILLYPTDLKISQIPDAGKNLKITVPLIALNLANNKLSGLNDNEQLNSKNNLSESDNAVSAIVKKRNDKISWVYYAGSFVSSVSFKGEAIKENINLNGSASPLPQVTQKDIKEIRNAALGFEAGVQMNYSMATKLQLTTGVHVTRSGYNIISNLVHPTLATLTLRNPSTGDSYSRNFVTHYGDGTGKSTVTLHNYSYQASIPLGVQYVMWNNKNLQIILAANVEPSLVLKADAYLLSANGKNYVNVPDLMRKWNFSSNFAPFVSFRSSRFKWNIGPDIRYQWLSTYQKAYTVKEHLIDYGIRVGISK